jgi:hypothetical protein
VRRHGAEVVVDALFVERDGAHFFADAFGRRRARRVARDARADKREVELRGLIAEENAIDARAQVGDLMVLAVRVVQRDEPVLEPSPDERDEEVIVLSAARLRPPGGGERGYERSRKRGRQEQACRATCQALPPYAEGTAHREYAQQRTQVFARKK